MNFERASQIRKAIFKKDACEMSKITRSELIDYIYCYNEESWKINPSSLDKPVRPKVRVSKNG